MTESNEGMDRLEQKGKGSGQESREMDGDRDE